MDDLPPLHEAQAAVKEMEEQEERDMRVFAPSVDPEEAADCQCQACPPRNSQEPGEYCCAALFALPLLQKGVSLRDGLKAEMKSFGSHACICQDAHFTGHILTDAVAEMAAKLYSMLSGTAIVDRNRSRRYGAYRMFVATAMGHLGHGQRIRLPSCFVHAVRQRWPSASYGRFESVDN